MFIGKQYYTTTVEIEPGEQDNYEFQEMTAMSNGLERDDNGRTMTGLLTFFLPAYKGMFFDEYGDPDEERAKVFLLNTRKKLEEEGKTRELSSFKRKNPMTFKEAFSADGETALYDPELINNHLDDISWGKDLTERGNLISKRDNLKLTISAEGLSKLDCVNIHRIADMLAGLATGRPEVLAQGYALLEDITKKTGPMIISSKRTFGDSTNKRIVNPSTPGKQ